jgi:hypothetical protein
MQAYYLGFISRANNDKNYNDKKKFTVENFSKATFALTYNASTSFELSNKI